MIAKLTAFLGLDGKNFTAGIDGAKKKATSLKSQMDGIGKGAKAGLAFFGISASIGALRGMVDYAKELNKQSGIELINTESLENASGLMDGLRASTSILVTKLASGFGSTVGFLDKLLGGEGGGFAGLGKDLNEAKRKAEEQRKKEVDLANFLERKEDYKRQQRIKEVRATSGDQGVSSLIRKEIDALKQKPMSLEREKKLFDLQRELDAEQERIIESEKRSAEEIVKKKEQSAKKIKDIEDKAASKVTELKDKSISTRFSADQLTTMGGGMRFDPRIVMREREIAVLEQIRDINEDTRIEIERISRGED